MLEFCKKASLFIVSALLFLRIIFPELFYNKMTYRAFLEAIDLGLIYSMETSDGSTYSLVTLIESHRINGKKVEDSSKRKYVVNTAGSDYAKDKAEMEGVKIIEKSHRIFSAQRISKFIIIVAIVLVIYYVHQRKRKTPAVEVVGGGFDSTEEIKDTKVTFADVAGLDEEKFELAEIVDFLKDPEKYTKLGAKIPRGVLLDGKPGTGKTLLAKAVAGEAGISFISASGAEFVNKYSGVGADNVRKLFEKAKQKAPCIVFIDEIDAIGRKRSEENCGGDGERNQTIAQLLTELDGFQIRHNIIIFAATNNPKLLDPALTRPGRFDRTIHIGLPNIRARKAILEIHSRNKPLFEDVSLESIAKNTAGFSGAQLENLLNEAAIHAARNQHIAISNKDLDEAFRKVTVGLKKSYIMSEEEKKFIASYEVGRAIVSLLMPTQPNMKEISIIPHGAYTWNDMTEDKNYDSKNKLMERLVVLMAGRASERIIIGDTSTRASKDIELATKIAANMVSVYGMDSEIGPISIGVLKNEDIILLGEKTLDNIEDKISKLLNEADEKATSLVKVYRELIEEMIQILIEQETMIGEEIQQIYNEYESKCAI